MLTCQVSAPVPLSARTKLESGLVWLPAHNRPAWAQAAVKCGEHISQSAPWFFFCLQAEMGLHSKAYYRFIRPSIYRRLSPIRPMDKCRTSQFFKTTYRLQCISTVMLKGTGCYTAFVPPKLSEPPTGSHTEEEWHQWQLCKTSTAWSEQQEIFKHILWVNKHLGHGDDPPALTKLFRRRLLQQHCCMAQNRARLH